MAEDPLRGKNAVGLFGVVLLNVVVFYGATQGNGLLAGDWGVLLGNLRAAVPACLGGLLIGVVNTQLPPIIKAAVVFWKWPNPLPGSEAFSRHMLRDERIDSARLSEKHGDLPTDPREQNKLWYRIYSSVAAQPAVAQCHKVWLFGRDYASLALMMVVLLGTAGFFQIPSLGTAFAYLGLLLAQFLLVRQSAKHTGVRFVTTVLALDAADVAQGEKSE